MDVSTARAPQSDAGRLPAGAPASLRGTWRSAGSPGANVSAVRLDPLHLAHSGLPEGWSLEDATVFFSESAVHAVELPEGAMRPPVGSLPSELESWMEVVRYAHRELWAGVPSLGTTLVLSTADALWVYARGAHRVRVACESGDVAPREIPLGDGRGRLWSLDPGARWVVETRVEAEKEVTWTARWVPAPSLVPAASGASPAVAAPPSRPSPLARPLAVVRRRWRRDPWMRRGVGAAGAIAGLALALALLPRASVTTATQWIGDVAWGRYRVRVTTVPEGTKLLVDGHDTGRLAPAWLVLSEGEHKVEVTLGEYGTTSFTVKGARGGRAKRSASLLGRLALGCADPTIVLYARVEGRALGRLPASLDSVPAGRRHVSFQGRDVTPWVEEVSVVAGQTTQFMARPERVPESGVVVARAYRVGPQGLKDQPGAVLFLDGKRSVVTPGKITVSRGLHTARLVYDKEASPVQLLRVEGGGELYATAEFGRSPEPTVADQLAGAPSIAAPPRVRASLTSTMPIRVSEMRLSVRRWGREFQRVSMTLRQGADGPVGEAELPLAGMTAGMALDYFVIIKSDDGEEFVSEMRTVKVTP